VAAAQAVQRGQGGAPFPCRAEALQLLVSAKAPFVAPEFATGAETADGEPGRTRYLCLAARALAECDDAAWERAVEACALRSVQRAALEGLAPTLANVAAVWRLRAALSGDAQLLESALAVAASARGPLDECWGAFARDAHAGPLLTSQGRATALVVMAGAWGLPPLALVREHAAVRPCLRTRAGLTA